VTIDQAVKTICEIARLSPNGKHALTIHSLVRQAVKDARPDEGEALDAALAHVRELRDAWQRGVLDERHPADDGWRSNRNMVVEHLLRKALQLP
jgi:hypothetical protein